MNTEVFSKRGRFFTLVCAFVYCHAQVIDAQQKKLTIPMEKITPTHEQMEGIKRLAQFKTNGMHVPLVRTPEEKGMAYKKLSIPSLGQMELRELFTPADGSDSLIIFNHHDFCANEQYSDLHIKPLP